MIDFKPNIFAALSGIPGVTISDAYPADFAKLPHLSFYELSNADALDTASPLSDVSFQIDIWHTRSTGPLALAVNEVMQQLGFTRQFSTDVPEAEGRKHKTMRYGAVLDARGYIYRTK